MVLLCGCLLCCLRPFLDLKVFSQRSQGMTIPSRWFVSMWSFMFLPRPSFPHTLQISAKHVLVHWKFYFGLFPSWTSPFLQVHPNPQRNYLEWLMLYFPQDWHHLLFTGIFALPILALTAGFMSSSKSSTFSSGFPVKPFSWSSSAIAKNESRFSWKTFASPQ